MRIRGTKPEFWKSRRIASTSWDARLVLKGLESYVDDNGVGVDDIELIVTDVFPRDMFANVRETVARVSEAITELHRAGLVHRYEGASDKLLYISFWESVQRIDKPGKGRNPRPDGTFEYKDSEIRESVANVPVTLAPVTGEQGNRGTGEQGISSSSSDADASDPEEFSDDVHEVCNHLAELIRRNGNKAKVNKTWLKSADRLMRLDDYTKDQVLWVIDWSQRNEFWQGNILSMPKLRDKFDQLKTRALAESAAAKTPARQTPADRAAANMALVTDSPLDGFLQIGEMP